MRKFRIHLSTAVVIMCIAGAFLYPNIVERHTHQITESRTSDRNEVGWPLVYQFDSAYIDKGTDHPESPMVYISAPNYLMLGGNIAIGLTLIAGLTALIEVWQSRRKKA